MTKAARLERVADALRRGAAGEIPPPIALMLAAFDALTVEELQAAIGAARGAAHDDAAQRLTEVAQLLAAHPAAFGTIKETISAIDHGPSELGGEAAVARLAAMFDTAVNVSPEASVALYSLGDPALLTEATVDVVVALDAARMLGPERRVLDLGCGIGRLEIALSGRVATLAGIDISAGMVAEARRRANGLGNITFAQTSGQNLQEFGAADFDAVVAVDSFPYVVEAGLARQMLAEIARVLIPGGDLMIFNYSYRGDAEADAAELRRHAAALGFSPQHFGKVGGRVWDARSYHLRKSVVQPA